MDQDQAISEDAVKSTVTLEAPLYERFLVALARRRLKSMQSGYVTAVTFWVESVEAGVPMRAQLTPTANASDPHVGVPIGIDEQGHSLASIAQGLKEILQEIADLKEKVGTGGTHGGTVSTTEEAQRQLLQEVLRELREVRSVIAGARRPAAKKKSA